METKEATRVIKLSDVQSLQNEKEDGYGRGNNSYIVERSTDTACIYKLFEDVKDDVIIHLSVQSSYNRSMFRSTNYEVVANFKRTNNVYGNPKKIQILTSDNKSDLTLKPFVKDNYYKCIEVGPLKINLNDVMHQTRFKLVENSGKFSVRCFGCNFPVGIYADSRHPDRDFVKAFDASKSFPVDYTRETRNKVILELFRGDTAMPIAKGEGIMKTLTRILPFYNAEPDFISKGAVFMAVGACKRTINNVKFSVIFNKLFEDVDTQEKFSAKALEISQVLIDKSSYRFFEELMDIVPEARDIKKAALKRKSTGAFNKIMNDLDFVKIDKDLYPITHEAVHSGSIPLGTFFRKNGESYFIYNDNWELWEAMLTEHKDIALEIAASCSGRTTYEKDIMSYFYFTLYELPEYLEAQTGKKWKGIPKLVNSSNELDPPKEGDNGVAKTRSALTPIVDNEKNTITVPYVSMRIGGYTTTYCYGLNYSVLKRGVSIMGNAVTRDVEKALNGRDDYGLMFYTLTGSSQGRGYPTFLIIFERLEKTTKVHFHRTHPMRSKGGDYNPIHAWTIGCYKWMIGNVNFERIKAQQGDLAFVSIDDKDFSEATEVNAYDNHCFKTPVKFLPYTKKDNQNVLGYVQLEKKTELIHNEHMNRIIPAGTYEIRQCRSWEANPKGIWSLRID